MLCTIWCCLYSLEDMKNNHGGVILLVKFQAEACKFIKSVTPPWAFSTFFYIAQMAPNLAKRLIHTLAKTLIMNKIIKSFSMAKFYYGRLKMNNFVFNYLSRISPWWSFSLFYSKPLCSNKNHFLEVKILAVKNFARIIFDGGLKKLALIVKLTIDFI